MHFSAVPNNNYDLMYNLTLRIRDYILVESIGEAVIEIVSKIASC